MAPTDQQSGNLQATELIYGLHDKPPAGETIFAAIQHLLAIFVPIITPALIICGVLGMKPATTGYIVSMSLFVSGIATFIQVKRIGPIGSGLLSIQGTSFAFIGIILTMGTSITKGAPPEEALPLIFGVCAAGSFIEMGISRFMPTLRRVITPLVSGIVVTLIGLTLIKAGVFNCAGGAAAQANQTFGDIRHVGLALFVLIVIVILNGSRNRWLRMSSIVGGLLAGYAAAAAMGLLHYSKLAGASWIEFPIPFRYGFAFSWSAFIPIALIYMVTAIETTGDLTATSMVSGEPIEGPLYMKRICGGMLGDGLNSLLAALFNTFPNTTFSQNNGVIQLTGIASRRVGFVIALLLVVLGLVPAVAGVLIMMPAAVLGGATLLMFATVAAAGVRIIASGPIDRRAILIMAISFGLGLGVTFEPALLDGLPHWIKNIFESGIVTGGLTAIICNILLPISPAHSP